MRSRRRNHSIHSLCAMVFLLPMTQCVSAEEKAKDKPDVKQGEYIVHHVAMCIYCHTPKNSQGELQRDQLLAGSAMPVRSPYPNQQWGFEAPSLRSLPTRWGTDQFVEFLQTGVTPLNARPRPPMPPFRMTKQDAEAVAAYLNTLPSDE